MGHVSPPWEGRKEVQTPAPSSMALTEPSRATSSSASQESEESVHRGVGSPSDTLQLQPTQRSLEANFLPVGTGRNPIPVWSRIEWCQCKVGSQDVVTGVMGLGRTRCTRRRERFDQRSGNLSGNMNEPTRAGLRHAQSTLRSQH